MTCHFCQKETARKFGKYGKKRVQRYRCMDCGKTFSDRPLTLEGSLVPQETALQVVHMLVEGVGINSAARMTGLHKRTVLHILEIAGRSAQRTMDTSITNVVAEDIECDELWSFVGKKQRQIRPGEDDSTIGDQYTWVAMDRGSRLILSFWVGKRTTDSAFRFMRDLASRISGHTQISTDGFKPYIEAVEQAFGMDADYAQIVKVFASMRDFAGREGYRPPECIGHVSYVIAGKPDEARIGTSYVERQNLTMRTFIRRMGRLSLGFSKKLANLRYAVALHFAYYNFCRVHGSLNVTPAMQAGLSDHVWTLNELIFQHG